MLPESYEDFLSRKEKELVSRRLRKLENQPDKYIKKYAQQLPEVIAKLKVVKDQWEAELLKKIEGEANRGRTKKGMAMAMALDTDDDEKGWIGRAVEIVKEERVRRGLEDGWEERLMASSATTDTLPETPEFGSKFDSQR